MRRKKETVPKGSLLVLALVLAGIVWAVIQQKKIYDKCLAWCQQSGYDNCARTCE